MKSCPWMLLLLASCQISQLFSQTEVKTYVDIHIHSSSKPFNSRSGNNHYNIWEPIHFECGNERSADVMMSIGMAVPKFSQAHFEALVRSNTRLVCLTLSPVEQQYINSSSYLNDKNKKSTISCLTGIVANQLFLRRKEIDYFHDMIENIEFLERFEGKPYYVNGIPHTYQLIRSAADIDSVLNDPNRIGVMLNIEGGHSLGHSIYINDKITNSEEYKDLVLENIRRLKGAIPISNNTDKVLNVPIMFIALCKTFPNGLGGSALSMTRQQTEVFTRPEDIGDGNTKLGKAVIDALCSSSEGGRAILVDIKHMSLEFRKFYYTQLERYSLMGTSIPIVASHCGISGLQYRSNLYRKKDDDLKNTNEYLNHWQQNLAEDDILKINDYKGLIGITLDKTVLGGNLALRRIDAALPNTRQKRDACLKLFLANVLKVIQVVNKPEAWQLVSLGSDFDNMNAPLDVYATAEQLPNLYADIQRFFEDPQAIEAEVTGFTKEEIKRLMFGLDATEIANKIMWKNALEFFKRQLEFIDTTRPTSDK